MHGGSERQEFAEPMSSGLACSGLNRMKRDSGIRRSELEPGLSVTNHLLYDQGSGRDSSTLRTSPGGSMVEPGDSLVYSSSLLEGSCCRQEPCLTEFITPAA